MMVLSRCATVSTVQSENCSRIVRWMILSVLHRGIVMILYYPHVWILHTYGILRSKRPYLCKCPLTFSMHDPMVVCVYRRTSFNCMCPLIVNYEGLLLINTHMRKPYRHEKAKTLECNLPAKLAYVIQLLRVSAHPHLLACEFQVPMYAYSGKYGTLCPALLHVQYLELFS